MGASRFFETIGSDTHCKLIDKRVGRPGLTLHQAYGCIPPRWTLASSRIQARTCGMEVDKAKL